MTSWATVIVWIHYGMISLQVPFGIPSSWIVWIHYGIVSVQVPFGVPSNWIVWIHYGINSTVLVSSHCCASSPLLKFWFIEEWKQWMTALRLIQSRRIIVTRWRPFGSVIQCATPLSLSIFHCHYIKHLSIKGCCVWRGPHHIHCSANVVAFSVGRVVLDERKQTNTMTRYCVWYVCQESR